MSFRVLYVTHVANMGGANRSLFQLVREMAEKYEVTPFVLGPVDSSSNGIKSYMARIGVEYIGVPINFFKIDKPSFAQLVSYLRAVVGLVRRLKFLKSYHIDIIHTNTSIIDIGAYLSRNLGCKHVWHFREFGDLDYGLYPLGGVFYEKFTYKHADAIIAISKVMARHFENKVPAKKLHVIFNGVFDVESKYVAQHKNQAVQFFCAGFISEGKNQKDIVNAVNILVNTFNITKFHVTIVGRKAEPYGEELLEDVRKYGLETFFSILPETDGIKEIARGMDVGVVPSKAEAFGRVTIEYQLQNLLVVASDQGANVELIQNGKTGLLYHVSDYMELASVMRDIIENNLPWEDIAGKGMDYAKSHYLSTYNTKAIFELYQTLF